MKTFFLALLISGVISSISASPRERMPLNSGWRFAFGHPYDTERDFDHGTVHFSYLAKAGYGDGPADPSFDDRTWRILDVPHDWAVEAPFDSTSRHSHGHKAVGRGFHERNIGWYRKTFYIPAEDFGRRIFIEFDGVFRDAKVWVNGFYCGNEPSGYNSFYFDITEYINHGSNNVVTVRVDATKTEGWFYEGAGIYRYVWLTKTNPLHVPQNGTFVTSIVEGNKAKISATIDVLNMNLARSNFQLENKIIDPTGRVVATSTRGRLTLNQLLRNSYEFEMSVRNPMLWDIETPHLYKLQTSIIKNGNVVDQYVTTFGIRTIEWTADRGFFLNGRHVKIKGTNNHQNHAGVGTAIPTGLHEWRLKRLKEMGNNTYRTAHYPPTPALLEAADRMGMLIINENRLMGTTDEMLDNLSRLIIRDRNHPSVILWSIGNEEWAIEGSDKGAQIAQLMQAHVKKHDTTRPVNAAVSGGYGHGISAVIEVMGFNYLRNMPGNSTDAHHARFPWQSSLGTEEGSTHSTRGVYFDDLEKQHMAAYDRHTRNGFFSIQHGWRHYAERDYLAGVCFWTGFDYRGEPTPFTWPSVTSYFGIMDLCGFAKDNFYYLKSWWSDEEVLHLFPHWNWQGKEGKEIDVWVYSNFEEVELFLNNRSLGRKAMERNGHLSWMVEYTPGTLKAVGFNNGKEAMTTIVETTDSPAAIAMKPSAGVIYANQHDISVVTVKVTDNKGRMVPTANHDIYFDISGPGRIIGVGNGNPTSHEPCRFINTYKAIQTINWREHPVTGMEVNLAKGPEYDCSSWSPAFAGGGLAPGSESNPTIFRGHFEIEEGDLKGQITWMFRSIGQNQTVFINGHLLGANLDNNQQDFAFTLNEEVLKAGKNVVTIVANPFVKAHSWSNINVNPGKVQVIIESAPWERKTFNGLAQVIIQSTGQGGTITLSANSPGLYATKAEIVATATVKEARTN